MSKEFNFSEKGWTDYWGKKIGRTWALIPMFEKNEEWEKNIPRLKLEFYGTLSLIKHDPSLESRLISIISKLEGLTSNEDFLLHRATVFEIISLIEELRDSGKIR